MVSFRGAFEFPKGKKKYMHEQVGGSAVVGGEAEVGGVEGTSRDGGGCRIRDVECKSMDGRHGLESGHNDLNFVGEGELERVSTYMRMRLGLVDWAWDTKVEAGRGRWDLACADGGWHMQMGASMCRWGPACADGGQCVQMGAETFPCPWVRYLKDYTVGFCDGTKGKGF